VRQLLPRREIIRKTRRWEATGLAGLWDQPDAPPREKSVRKMRRDTYGAPAARGAGAPEGLPPDVAALIESGEFTWPQVRQFRMVGNTYPDAASIRRVLKGA
jgi:hypothetical protein